MYKLWSASTTMRNPVRIPQFLKTINEIEGKIWNHKTQEELQIRLIKNRYYTPTGKKLSAKQIGLLNDLLYELNFEEAKDIFYNKDYTDPPMRGRTSFDPIEKLGLVRLESKNGGKYVKITEFGKLFLKDKISLEEVVFSSLLKQQLPNPLVRGFKKYNTKPFINCLHLINYVNEICMLKNIKTKGVSRDEFGIFVLSIRTYEEVKEKTNDLIRYRLKYESLSSYEEKQDFRKSYIEKYLADFNNPLKNVTEYADNIIRYLRLTKYIYLRGNGYYVDLEPRRKIEIDMLLKDDNGRALKFATSATYYDYMGDYNAYKPSFENYSTQIDIAKEIILEINVLEKGLAIEESKYDLDSYDSYGSIKSLVKYLRDYRITLKQRLIKETYRKETKIEEAIKALKNIRELGIKPSIALEKWCNIALNIINDAINIKPNSPMGDDNEPVFTAPANVPDIECFYEEINAICEVTMLTSRDQWFNEGQPVMRHLRDFETRFEKNSYCLFIAPRLHRDTINTFYMAVKYEYEGKAQRIIPITISQLIRLVETVKELKEKNKKLSYNNIRELFDSCIILARECSSDNWPKEIELEISSWINKIVS